jgi:hypothetical protein
MFPVQVIEVLGTQLGTDTYIKEFVSHNCIKVARNVENPEPITDGFVFFQMVKFCLNTCTQYMSTNITLPTEEQFLSAQDHHIDTSIVNFYPSLTLRTILRDLCVGVCQQENLQWKKSRIVEK